MLLKSIAFHRIYLIGTRFLTPNGNSIIWSVCGLVFTFSGSKRDVCLCLSQQNAQLAGACDIKNHILNRGKHATARGLKNRSIGLMGEREKQWKEREEGGGGRSTVALTSRSTQSPPSLQRNAFHGQGILLYQLLPPSSQPPTPHGWTADELEPRTKSSRRASDNRTPRAKERRVLSLSHFLPHWLSLSCSPSLSGDIMEVITPALQVATEALRLRPGVLCVCACVRPCVHVSPAGRLPAPQSVRWGELRIIFPCSLDFSPPPPPPWTSVTHVAFLLDTLWYACKRAHTRTNASHTSIRCKTTLWNKTTATSVTVNLKMVQHDPLRMCYFEVLETEQFSSAVKEACEVHPGQAIFALVHADRRKHVFLCQNSTFNTSINPGRCKLMQSVHHQSFPNTLNLMSK